MAGFNFGAVANTTGVASDRRLRAYTINKVTFAEAKVAVIHSDKNNTDYDVLNVKFTSDAGLYEENFFLPSTSGRDIERQPNNWGGEQPSNADRAMMFVAHLLSVINHDGFEKLKKVIGKMTSFKQVAEATAKLLNEKKNTECYLKLTGRTDDQGRVFASLPYFTGISKETHEAYVSNNFLSLKDDLAFTPSEDKKRQEFESAKPTAVDGGAGTSTAVSTVTSVSNSDIDQATEDELGSLLNDL